MRVFSTEIAAQELSAWQLAQALRLKIESCPEQGARGQMLNCLDALVRAGGIWMIVGPEPGEQAC